VTAAGLEYNPNIPEEDPDEGEPTPDDGEPQDPPPAEDAAKLKKALERERAAKKKALSELSELRRQAQQGDPNKGEMEKLTEQVGKLQQSIATKDRVTLLLEAGFNQGAAKAEKILRLVDNFDDDEWIDELKVDYPERFGKARRAPEGDGGRPSTGYGRAPAGGPPKDVNATHVDKMLNAARRR
jgi:hypothetical protein